MNAKSIEVKAGDGDTGKEIQPLDI